MTADPDIQFGDLEEEQPDVELRPDRNAHYAVVPYEEPAEGELPVFIDLDVLIEMESHALTDTSVELGGVMLGGQLHDEDGQPYVLVQDSVRAQHYEATKGSFKFTHDTWQQITKDRDEFPSDWDMVGWYHTHPDWGVFLSGMDMFICDNFFNKPLDVALVIDPCRQDRAFFQWTGDPRERKRRVSGFYVIASRHRQAELERFVAELEGGYTMRTNPNLRDGYNVSGGGGAPTVVNITEQRPGWMGQAIVGMLFVQLVMLLMFGYMAFSPREEQATGASSERQRLLAIEEERELDLRRDVLDDVIKSMSGEDEVAKKLETRTLELDEAQQELLISRAGVPKLIEERDKLAAKLKEKSAAYDAAEKGRKTWKERAEEAEKELEKAQEGIIADDGEETWYAQFLTGPWLAVGLVVVVFAGAAGYFAFRGMTEQNEIPENLRTHPPPEGNVEKIHPPEDPPANQDDPAAEAQYPPDDGVGYEDEPPRREG